MSRPGSIPAVIFLFFLFLHPGCSDSNGDGIGGQPRPDLLHAPQLAGVTMLADRLNFLVEINRKTDVDPVWIFGRKGRDHDFSSDKLPGDLRYYPARLTTIGRLDDFRLLVYEAENRTLLTLDLMKTDTDADGLSDEMEELWRYDPLNPNTDGDEFLDGEEVPHPAYRVMVREELLSLFEFKAMRPVMGVAVELQNGWLLVFEEQSKSLLAVRADPRGGPGIIANPVLTQEEIQEQLFPPPRSKSTVTILQMLEFQKNQILVVPFNPNLAALDRLMLEEELDGEGYPVALRGRFALRRVLRDQDDVDWDQEHFLEFENIAWKTGYRTVGLRSFQPILIPGTGEILLFDRFRDSSSFISVKVETGLFTEELKLAPHLWGFNDDQVLLSYPPENLGEIVVMDPTEKVEYRQGLDYTLDVVIEDLDPLEGLASITRLPDGAVPPGGLLHIRYTDGVPRASVEVKARREKILQAIGESDFDREFLMKKSFLHPRAGLDPGDEGYRPWILAFDEESNDLLELDFSGDPGVEKIRLLASSRQLEERIDPRFDPEFDSEFHDPRLWFARNHLPGWLLAFDIGPSEIIAMDIETGQVVVVAHRRDLTRVTGLAVLNLDYAMVLDPPPLGDGKILRVLDRESTSLLEILLEYGPVSDASP